MSPQGNKEDFFNLFNEYWVTDNYLQFENVNEVSKITECASKALDNITYTTYTKVNGEVVAEETRRLSETLETLSSDEGIVFITDKHTDKF